MPAGHAESRSWSRLSYLTEPRRAIASGASAASDVTTINQVFILSPSVYRYVPARTHGEQPPMPGAPMDTSKLHDFATRYTAAWCSQDAASVASFFAMDGSLRVNAGAPAV